MLSTKETEIALIGTLVDDPSKIDIAAGLVSRDDFSYSEAGKGFDVLLNMHKSGKPVGDQTIVIQTLQSAGVIGTDATQITVEEFQEAVYDSLSTNVTYYCAIIATESSLRKMREVFNRALESLDFHGAEPSDIVAGVNSQLESIMERSRSSSVALPVYNQELVDSLRVDMEQERPKGLPTGIDDLDELVGGLVPGELTVIGARPGGGKTTLLMQILRHCSRKGFHSLFASLEMSGLELAMRVLCADADVRMMDIRSPGLLTSSMVDRMQEHVNSVFSKRIDIYHNPQATAQHIRAAAKVQKMTGGLDIVAVDYLSLVKPTDTRKMRNEQVAESIQELRGLAQELHIPVVVLSQLNRGADGSRPTMGNLRDSGMVEQVADVVMLLHNVEEEADHVELIVDKARQAKTGIVPLEYNSSTLTLLSRDIADNDVIEVM